MKNCMGIFALAMLVSIASGNTHPVSAQLKRVAVDESVGLPKAVVASSDTLIFTSQIFPLDRNGEIQSQDDVANQTGKVLAHLGDLLKSEFGRELADVARLCVYVTADEATPVVRREIATRFPQGNQPTVSCVVTPLPVEGAKVAIDAVATLRQGKGLLGGVVDWKSYRSSNNAHNTAKNRMVGYYGMPADDAADFVSIPSQRLILVSGQAEPGELRESIRKTWQSLEKTVEWAGGDSDHIAHVKVFMNTVDDVPAVFEEIAKVSKWQPKFLPPISFVQWTNKGATEIEVIAAQSREIDKNSEPVRHLNPPWMTESPVYCKVAVTNSDRLIFTSGLYGTPGSDSETQVNSMFTELDGLMKECGSDLQHLAKATYYVANDEVSGKLTTLRPKYYDPKHPPAASKASVIGVGQEKCTITLDMIAVPIGK